MEKNPPFIQVSIKAQRLYYFDTGELLYTYPVSTAVKGAGECRDSEKTPRGRHVVRARVGGGLPVNTVFVGRRPTGEIYSSELAAMYPDRDWILTRILWLSGLEVGKNRLGDVDTMQRMIYIHGFPDDKPIGEPGSHGCIRMRNTDLIELFDITPVGTVVNIFEK